MKKKLVSYLLVAAMSMTLISCAGKTGESESGAVNSKEEIETSVSQDADSEEKAEDTEKEEDATEVSEAESEEKTEETEKADETEKTEEESTETATEELTMENALPGQVVDGIVKVAEKDPVEIPDNDALNFVRDLEAGWNLGNCFDAFEDNYVIDDEMKLEDYWCGAKATKELIVAIKDAGFKAIRIPVSWHNHVDADYNISEDWMNRVEEVVGWAYEEGLYVIINIHHDNNLNFEYPSYEKLDQSKAYVTKIWTQIADRFADYDEHLIFETMNEPRQVGQSYEWWVDARTDVGKECVDCVNQLNQVIVDTIRSSKKGYNTTRYIMAPGYCANPDFALVDSFVLPDDSMAEAENRIIVSVHAYTPYNFALNMEAGSTDVFDIAGNKGTADIFQFMKKLYEKFVSNGIPVVIGEYGALDKGNLESRMQFAAYYTYTARHFGMSAFFWDNNAHNTSGENFRLIDRSNITWTFPEIVDQIMYYCNSKE